MRIYRITTRHSQLTDVSTPHTPSDLSGVGSSVIVLLNQMYSEILQGNWSGGVHDGYFLNSYFYNTDAGADGDGIRYKCYMRKGTYKLFFFSRKGPNDGIVDIKIDGNVVATIDLYHPDSNVYNAVSIVENIVVSDDGLKTIDLVVNGKNPDSTGYTVSLSALCFILTST